MKKHLISAALAGLMMISAVRADTINFTQLPSGALGSAPVTVDGVTFNGEHDLYNWSDHYFPEKGGAICGYDGRKVCQADMTVGFNGVVKRVRLATAAFGAGDSVTITAFNRGRTKGSVTVTGDQVINLRSFGKITKLVLDDSSTDAGGVYGKFKFRRVTTTAKGDQDGKIRHSGKANRALTQ